MAKTIGILTAGGDSPGLNAAIRGVGKAAIGAYGMHVVGFRDGFRGLMENRGSSLSPSDLSGILTIGGTILGTSRDKPNRMPVGKKTMDMTDAIVATYHKHHLDGLVCLGGGGTQKNAYHLLQNGLNVITLPKTIDNDVALTDASFGFDTALGIATDAIDRLHSTAHSHHRIIVVEVMGHNAGWLALGAGIAGGADVILIPEIPYDSEAVAEAIRHRSRTGSRFSIVAVSEGAMSRQQAATLQQAQALVEQAKAVRRSSRAERRESQGGESQVQRDQGAGRQQHAAAVAGARAADRAGVAGHDSRPSAAGRHAVRGRPSARDPPGHGVRRADQPGHVRRHGRHARRRHRAGPARGRGRPAQDGAARSSLDPERAGHRCLPR